MLQLRLPPNFQVGQAKGDGDCFFDSVAQGLKQLKPELEITVKSLRLVCKSFAQSQSEDEQSWLKEALKRENEQINEYIPRIKFTVNDVDQYSEEVNVLRLTSPIWGRSEIEGRIICAEYNVTLYVAEKRIVKGEEIWAHKIVDSEGSQSLNALDYKDDENAVYVVHTSDLHFDPMLRVKVVQHSKQRSPTSDDGSEEDVKMTPDEELFNAIKCNDPEAEKVTRVKKLLEGARKLDINFQGINKDTCLHIAVRKKELKVIKLLLQKGARIDIQNDRNRSPLDVAIRINRQEIVKILKSGSQQFSAEEQMKTSQEIGEERNKKLEEGNVIPCMTNGKAPLREDLESQKDEEKTKKKLLYKRRPGTSGIHGQLYETRLLMWFLLQAEAKEKIGKIKKFFLAANMEDAGNFDDVVFKYKYSENGEEKWKIIFLQAKHHDKEKKIMINTFFNLQQQSDQSLIKKCLNSYKIIKEDPTFKKNNPLLQEDKERSDFVIYTNAKFKFDKSNNCIMKKNEEADNVAENTEKYFLKVKVEPDNILYFVENHEKYYCKLEANEEVKKGLDDGKIDDKTIIEEFLKDLKLFCNQPNVDQLEEAIKKIITDVFDIKEQYDTTLIYSDVHNTIIKLWRKHGKVEYLTEHDKLFNKAKENLLNLKLVGLAKLEVEPITSLGLKFKSDEIQRLSKLIRKNRIIHIISDAVLLCTIKVYQALEGMPEYESKNDSSRYIFLNLTYALKLKNEVIGAFKSEMRDALVIKCDETETNFEQLYEELKDTVKGNDSKKIILITRQQFKHDFSVDCDYVQEKDINNSFTDLDMESQELLEKKKVIFQGIEMELGTLVDEKSKNLIGADILSQLINNEPIKVGKALDDLDEIKCYYIDRMLHRQVSISKGCFKERNIKDIFVVSNIKKNELKFITGRKKVCKFDEIDFEGKKPLRFIILDDNENVQENWKQLYTNYSTSNIHWLKKEGYKYIWQASHGSLSNLRKFVDEKDTKEYRADKISNIADRIVIVSAEPGMGKSVLLTKLAKKEIKADPSLWLVRINLNDHTKELNDTNFNNINLNGIINLLSEILDLKSTLEKQLLEHRLKRHGKIGFLFDGFDEISPDYKVQVITLLKTLKEMNIDKMWITTRPHMRNELEDNLSVLSYTLKPLSTEDQKHFLSRFWVRKLGFNVDTDNNRLNTYIEELLKCLSISIADNERNLTGIPLQTRILAEVYQDQFQEFYNSDENIPNFLSKLNLLDLYQSFIDKKYNIWIEKNKADLTNTSARQVYKEHYSKFILQHQLLALQMLFANQEAHSLLSSKERKRLEVYKKEIIEGHERTGIVNCVSNDTIKFIHRTFAEYFAAQWLANNQEKNKEARKFLKFKLFKIENLVLRYFFDRMLASDTVRSEIHIAVLNNDIHKVEELSLGSPSGKADKGGRTALHIAAANNFLDIVNILTNVNAEAISTKDKIFGWRPLHYADKISYWPVADLLLQKGASDNDMVQTIRNIKSNPKFGDDLLRYAAKTGLVKLTEFLIKKKVDINTKSSNRTTPLHSAAQGGHIEVFKLLIDKKADMNSQDNNRNTVLHYAAFGGKLDMLKFLINTKIDLNCQNNIGNTVLHYATIVSNLNAVNLLVEKGANINIQNNGGNTVLHMACFNNLTDAVKLFIKNGADCNCPNKDEIVPLHYAALRGSLNLVKFLVEKGADFKCADKNNNTVLYYAAAGGNLDIVKFLTEKIVNLNCQNNNGDTVLHYAAQNGKLDVAKFLIEQGADLNSKNKLGHTVLHSAAINRNWDLVKVLIEEEVDLNAQDMNGDTIQHYAALSGNLDMLKLLIGKRADFKCQNKIGNTVLFSAAQSGNWQVVKFLIEKGADFKCKNIFGYTVLHCAALRGNLNLVKFLIEKGADFNSQNDNNNNTVLQSAAWGGNIDVVKFLVEKGADFKYQNIIGRSVLHAAAEKGNWDIVKYLLHIGADLYCKNGPILHSAAGKGQLDVKFHIEKGANSNSQNNNVRLELVGFSGFQ